MRDVDEFLDQIGTKAERPELQVALLRKLGGTE